MTKHTPAPWHIVTDGISHWIEIEPNKIALIKANEADRNLIAAAPDVLAALKALREEYKHTVERAVQIMHEHGHQSEPASHMIQVMERITGASAAIAKAEGK